MKPEYEIRSDEIKGYNVHLYDFPDARGLRVLVGNKFNYVQQTWMDLEQLDLLILLLQDFRRDLIERSNK